MKSGLLRSSQSTRLISSVIFSRRLSCTFIRQKGTLYLKCGVLCSTVLFRRYNFVSGTGNRLFLIGTVTEYLLLSSFNTPKPCWSNLISLCSCPPHNIPLQLDGQLAAISTSLDVPWTTCFILVNRPTFVFKFFNRSAGGVCNLPS